MTEWPKIEVDVDAEVADDVGAELLDAGAMGVEQQDLPGGGARLVAYFSEAPPIESIADRLARMAGVRSAPVAGATPDDDWLRIWKRGFEPIPIGRRLLVLPSWKRDLADNFSGRARIEIDPGMAFGTGTHDTTRMCLEWLDEHWHGGTLLDVGTGTGILAIAAVLLEPESQVVAVDVDPVAVEVARENAAANRAAQVTFAVGGPGDVGGRFDVVMANLTADVIVSVIAPLLDRLLPGGALVLSGILLDQGQWVVDAFTREELDVVWKRESGEWMAIALRAPLDWG